MLCLWLPFTDGTTKNYGLTDMDVVDYGTSVYDQGKLGKCRSFVGNGYLQLSNAFGMESGKDFSCCYWIKEISNNILSKFRVVYQCGNLIIGHYGNKFDIYSITGNTLDLVYVCDTTEWVHCCMTYQSSNNTVTIYINGVKCSTSQPKNLTGLSDTTALIGKRSSETYLFEGYLNDFRIYNTCLSPRQIKEISKGLICHYPLGEIDGKIGGRNLLVKTNQGKTKWANAHADGSYSCESVNWNGINAVKMSCATPTTSWRMFMFNGLLENFDKLEPSAIYTLSYDVIGNVRVGFPNLWDSDATHSIIASAQETVIKKPYGFHYVVNITLKDALNKSKQLVYFKNNLKAGESVIIANLKLEKGNKATAYTPCPTDDPVMYDNMIYDTSGYCNNGSVSGDILWDTNTPRYNGAYDFNGTGYIYNDNLNLTTTAFTISFWIKIPSAITHQHFDFATFNSWTSEGVGIYWDTSGQKSSSGGIFGKDSNGDKIHVGVQCRGQLNEWTHFAITWDGTNVYRYSNGIKFSESDFNAVSVYHPRLWLGNSTFGDRTLENSESCMSDFRFYATALSDSDILELYQSSASVDNNGNLMVAGEVVEE
ncbi:MAG: LamG domain-containing protein [Coprococcus eutactus]